MAVLAFVALVSGATMSPNEAAAQVVLARLYAARGVRDPKDEATGLKGLLGIDPLLGLSQAAEALAGAIVENETVLVVGDYDAAI